MNQLIIKISDPKGGVVFPELRDKFAHESTATHCGILLGGMASGRPSIGLMCLMPDGKYTLVQLTPSILEGICAAMHGAEQRGK